MLSLTKATKLVQALIVNNVHSTFMVLTICMVLFLLLGMVMDTGPSIIILSPILLPAVTQLGVDPVHFGVILCCCLSIGLATPPFGLDLFVAGNLSDLPPMNIAKRAMPFIISFFIAMLLVVYVPQLSTFLPSLL